MANKITKKDYFKMILEVVGGNEELENFVNHELELLDRKSSGTRKPTKTQEENIGIMETIKAELERIGTPVTISELQEQSEELSKDKFTNQKLSALMKKLVDNKEIVKVTEKKKSYFSIAITE